MKNTSLPCSYKAPRVAELVRSVENGKSVSLLIEKQKLKLIVRPYGKRQAYAGLFWDEEDKRKQFYPKTDNEEQGKEEFKDHLVRLVNNICDRRGLIVQTESTLSFLFDEFCEHKSHLNLAPATLEAYKSSADLLIRTIGDKQIREVGIHIAQDFVKFGWLDPRTGKHCPWKRPATVRKHVRHLKIFWNYCLKYHSGLISDNVWCKVEIPLQSYTVKPIPETTELTKIWQSIDPLSFEGRTLNRLTKFICQTGLRIEELGNLRVRDVNSSKKIIMVENTSLHRTKNRSSRPVPLNSIAANLVAEQLQDNLENNTSSDYCFPKTSYWTLRDRWDSALCRAGYRKSGFTFHSLRRYFGTKHLQAGTPIYHIQQWFGHSTQQTTARYLGYTSAMDQQARGCIENYANQFNKEYSLSSI